jgi:hypothetical protein
MITSSLAKEPQKNDYCTKQVERVKAIRLDVHSQHSKLSNNPSPVHCTAPTSINGADNT